MNGRIFGLMTALVATTAAFAGCMAPSDLLAASSETEVTALANRDIAFNAAQSWDPASQLLGVFSLELAHEDGEFPLDPEVGNGKAPVWVFAFSGENNATRAFRVTADGRVSAENDTMDAAKAADDLMPLTAWKIDSDAALDTAAEDATFAKALQGEGATIAEGVAQMEGITGWYFAAMSDGGSAIAIVNAATGELVMAKSFSMDIPMPSFGQAAFSRAQPFMMEGEGEVDAEKPANEFPFHSPSGEAILEVEVSADTPLDGLRWILIDSEDEGIEQGWFGRQPFSDESGKFEFEIPDAGDYTLVFAYDGITPLPLGGSVEYAFELTVGEMLHEHDDDEE